MRVQLNSPGAMFCFSTVEGNKVYVDPDQVAYVEVLPDGARIGFSAGGTLVVRDDIRAVHEIIRAYKQGEQD